MEKMTYSELKDEICNTWLQLDAEQMAQVRIALLELSTTAVEIPRMRDIYRCSDLASILRLLEKWKLLTPTRVGVLLRLTELVGHHTEMVRERLQAYQKLNLQPEQRNAASENQRSASVNQVYLDVCEYLSENLRGRWADVSRFLGFADLVSDLQRTPQRQKDKVYQVLEEHYKISGSNAIPLILQALEKASLFRQRDHVISRILQK